jgi:hypothetical protein
MHMIKKACFLTIILFSFLRMNAQDTLVLRNNTREVCTVVHAKLSEIEYIPWVNNPTKLTYAINKSLVQYIIYNTGTIDTLNPVKQSTHNLKSGDIRNFDAVADSTPTLAYNNFQLGRRQGYVETPAGGYVAAGAVSIVMTSASIVVPLVISVVKVKEKNIKSPTYFANKSVAYREGYLKGVARKRRAAVWAGYGGSVAVITGLVLALVYL